MLTTIHGGYSDTLIRAKARAHRRRVLRRIRIDARNLDPILAEWLVVYANASARADLLPLSDPAAWTARNTVIRSLREFAKRLRELGLDAGVTNPGSALERHLSENYGEANGDA